jgi:hypothetical protein
MLAGDYTWDIMPESKDKKSHRVAISQGGGEQALRKRQATAQLCFRPALRANQKQPRPSIIFRGKGTRVSAVEKSAYHPNVKVFFQPKAWADSPFCEEWIKWFATEVGEPEEEKLLLCDNLAGQVAEGFRAAAASANITVWYLSSGNTDKNQPVDAGYGQSVRKAMGRLQDEWLLDPDNLGKWTGDKTMSASDRRVLLTIWLGEAVEEVNKNADMLRKCFEHTGCHLAADLSEDHLVQFDGMVKPLDYLQGAPLPDFSVLGHDEVAVDIPDELPDDQDEDIDSWDNGGDEASQSGNLQ